MVPRVGVSRGLAWPGLAISGHLQISPHSSVRRRNGGGGRAVLRGGSTYLLFLSSTGRPLKGYLRASRWRRAGLYYLGGGFWWLPPPPRSYRVRLPTCPELPHCMSRLHSSLCGLIFLSPAGGGLQDTYEGGVLGTFECGRTYSGESCYAGIWRGGKNMRFKQLTVSM